MTRNKSPYTFIDLFAGIGGFHLGMAKAGAECVFASEWDEAARKTYLQNFKNSHPKLFSDNLFFGDITKVIPKKDIPDFDVLCAGFPCQPFSNAGFKKGFSDHRGNLFFDIARIIKEKKPKAFILENVRGLYNHDGGRTFSVIREIIQDELNYSFTSKIIKGTEFGVPQFRPRLYMVGFSKPNIEFEFPQSQHLKKTMSDIFGAKCSREIGFTLRCGGRGSGLGDRRNWDCYLVDGKETRIGPREGKLLQGFPASFKFPVSETQAMKQLGNSVVVPVIKAIGKQVILTLKNNY